MNSKLLFCVALAFLIACSDNADKLDAGKPGVTIALPYDSIRIVMAHDTSSFTEGLLLYKDTLYESTGEYGHSKLLQLDPRTGKTIKRIPLNDTLFGEGITILNDTLYQLTWREHTVLVYDLKTWKKVREIHTMKHEGWGLTTDGKELIISDGSSTLYYYQPSTFRLLKTVMITDDGSPIGNINELEYIDGYIYANQADELYL